MQLEVFYLAHKSKYNQACMGQISKSRQCDQKLRSHLFQSLNQIESNKSLGQCQANDKEYQVSQSGSVGQSGKLVAEHFGHLLEYNFANFH